MNLMKLFVGVPVALLVLGSGGANAGEAVEFSCPLIGRSSSSRS